MDKQVKILHPIFVDPDGKNLKIQEIFTNIPKVEITDVRADETNYMAIFIRQPYRVAEYFEQISPEAWVLMQKGLVKPLIMTTYEQWDLFEIFKEFNDSPYKYFIKNFLDRDIPEENITWVVPDHNHKEQIKYLKSKGHDVKCRFLQYNSLVELMSKYANKYNIKNHKISKHFSCLCKGRPRHNRIGMIYNLWYNNLLTKGNISCESYTNTVQTKGYHWIDDKMSTDQFMSKFDGWDETQEQFKQDLPMSFDDQQNKHWWPDVYDESALFESAFVWIACETAKEQDGIFITEKTLKAVAYGKPFLINGDSGSIEYLKSIGYKTFADFWDESYDLDNSVQKIEKITKIIKNICTMSLTDINSMYNDMLPILKHNQNLLRNTNQYDTLLGELQNG